jgi:hypothetical protein
MDVKPYTVDEVLPVLLRKCEEVVIDDGGGSGSQAFAHHHAGKFLGLCLWRLVPDGVTFEEWDRRLREVRDGSDIPAAVAWFERELPRLIQPIPPKHR